MTSIQMPQLGETIVEGTILKWLKKEGEAVDRDEPLFEISTDKVDTEVPSPVAGTLTKIIVAEGETVPVGTELAEIDGAGGGAQPASDEQTQAASDGAGAATSEDGESDATSPEGGAQAAAPASSDGATDRGSAAETPGVEPSTASAEATGVATASPEPATAAAATANTPTPAPQPSSGGGSSPATADGGPRSQILSPVVRKLAQEHGIDLSTVRGTGTGGRITRKDVEAAVASGAQPATPAAAPSGAALRSVPAAASAGEGMESEPLSHIRKAIGKHMLASVNETARAWTLVEANVEHLVRLRERTKDAFAERYGAKLTYLPFVVRATIDALQAFPTVNGRIDGDNVILHRYVHMGIAVSYDAGLIVPVIKGADGMNTVGIARAIADLAARARSHELRPDEVQGATFTITNPGPYGSLASVPIINQPNTGILSLDAIQKRPVVVEGDAIAVRHMVNISMSWDHRLIDGEIATRFLARVKQNLESWDFAEDLGL
ncbi:MAG TPA: dihydrolipoamide acetyltransferase family protein [Actinomycetota bacterium]|nr:dihydrolipoamide acetyltransferase family protein [Actinomycetota bacterium]